MKATFILGTLQVEEVEEVEEVEKWKSGSDQVKEVDDSTWRSTWRSKGRSR
jgi:hypothetical protein